MLLIRSRVTAINCPALLPVFLRQQYIAVCKIAQFTDREQNKPLFALSMRPYSCDLRQKIVSLYNQGEGSIRQLAHRFAVSPDFVQRLLKH